MPYTNSANPDANSIIKNQRQSITPSHLKPQQVQPTPNPTVQDQAVH